jgi:hypothetical protein
MTTDERKRMLAAVFDSVRPAPKGWTGWSPARTGAPYIVAAIPKPMTLLRAPSERKTGLEPAVRALRTIRVRDGGLDLVRRAA